MRFTLRSLALSLDDSSVDPVRAAATWATRFITAALVGAMLFHVVQAKLTPPTPPVVDDEPSGEVESADPSSSPPSSPN